MQGKQTVRGAALAVVALVALAVASSAPAGGTATIAISARDATDAIRGLSTPGRTSRRCPSTSAPARS